MNTKQLLQHLQADYPVTEFKESPKARWDPSTNTIYYDPVQPNLNWSLLHEIGHMEAGHKTYTLDIQLLMMETEAWEIAKQLSKKYDQDIDTDHIEDCIDSYRDWLHKRSSCPKCTQTGLQTDKKTYKCLNCGNTWQVSASRFCRPYRKTKNTPSNKA